MQAWNLAERNIIGKSQLEKLSALSEYMSQVHFEYNKDKCLYSEIACSHKEALESSVKSIQSIIEYIKSQSHQTGKIPEEALTRLEQRIDYFLGDDTYNTSHPVKNPHHFLLSGQYMKSVNDLDYRVSKLLRDSILYKNLRRKIKRECLQLASTHYIKLYILEGAFPITIALIGICKSQEYLLAFLHEFIEKF